VLDRNWRCPGGEIDVVVRCATAVVFVEVKARASDRYGPAAAAVDHRKQRRVRIAALRWLDAHPDHRGTLRFDVVAITGSRVEVIEGAY
jgi:putative endonuclease